MFDPVKELDVVPNFVDPDRWKPDDGERGTHLLARAEWLLLHVSNFRPVKAVSSTSSRSSTASGGIPSRRLMIGDGPDRPAA